MRYGPKRCTIYEANASSPTHHYCQIIIETEMDRQGQNLETDGRKVLSVHDGYFSAMFGHRVDVIPLNGADIEAIRESRKDGSLRVRETLDARVRNARR
jgi:hypothetical protein